MLGDRPAVTIQHKLDPIELAPYVMVVGRREVLVMTYAKGELSDAWAGIDDKVAGSVRAE